MDTFSTIIVSTTRHLEKHELYKKDEFQQQRKTEIQESLSRKHTKGIYKALDFSMNPCPNYSRHLFVAPLNIWAAVFLRHQDKIKSNIIGRILKLEIVKCVIHGQKHNRKRIPMLVPADAYSGRTKNRAWSNKTQR